MDYTTLIKNEMLYHAKRAAYRINRLKGKNPDFIVKNAHYELVKLYGELRSLSMINLPHNVVETDRLMMRFRAHIEKFYYKSVFTV